MIRLKGRLQLHRFVLGHRWAYVCSAIGLVIALITAVLAPPGSAGGFVIAALATGLGVATFARDSRDIARRGRSMHQIELGDEAIRHLQKSDRYADYDIIRVGRYAWLYSEGVNRLLTETASPVESLEGRFELSGPADECASFVLTEHFGRGSVLFNDSKIRLVTDLTTSCLRAGSLVNVERTDYFSSLCTNEVTTREVRVAQNPHPILHGPSLMSSQGIVDDLSSSKCSNHIGVSTLAFTSDGCLIVTTQAATSAQSPNQLAASGAGSMDWTDLAGKTDLQHLVVASMSRELCEELGLGSPASAQVATRLVGFARLLNRGAKPEFFGVSYVNCPSTALKVDKKEALFVADIRSLRLHRADASVLKQGISEFEKTQGSSFAPSLALCVRCLQDYLDHAPDEALTFIAGTDFETKPQ